MTNIPSTKDLAVSAWDHLLQGLEDASRLEDPWVKRYLPDTKVVNDYTLANMERFCMLYDVLDKRLQANASVLDAGAGYGIQAALFKEGGYMASASDIYPRLPIFDLIDIDYRRWNLEAEAAPFESESFDAILLSQTIEHFTYSPRHPIQELLRILKPGGWVLIDAPNISSFHNIWRLVRGKTIHWSLMKHYLEQEPLIVANVPYYDRHNHEYAKADFEDIAKYFGLKLEEVRYYSPLNPRKPAVYRLFAQFRDLVPVWRKGIYALFKK